jgi:hypothetical protein
MVGADAVRYAVIGRIQKTEGRGTVEITQHPWTKMEDVLTPPQQMLFALWFNC